MDTFKDFELTIEQDGVTLKRTFRLDVVAADVGNWIAHQLITGKYMDDIDVYQKIKNYVFNLISIYKDPGDGRPIPVKIFENGKWLIPTLGIERDVEAFNGLFNAMLEYNFSPFLRKLKLKADAEKAAEEARQLQERSSGTFQ